MIPTNSRNETSKILDSLIRKWLAVFGEIYKKEVSNTLPKLWVAILGDIAIDKLELAFKEVLKTFTPTHACPFPTPAHVRVIFAEAEEVGEDVAAENAWLRTKRYCMKWGNTPGPRPPITDPIAEVALRAAGGMDRIESCPEGELQWAQKKFIETYERYRRAPELCDFMSLSLQDIIAKALPNQTKSLTITDAEVDARRKILDQADAVQADTSAAFIPPAPPMTDEEFEKRRRELLNQAEQVAKAKAAGGGK